MPDDTPKTGEKPPADEKPPTDAPKTDDKPDADEVAKWKAMARKHESNAKANADAAAKLKEIEDSNKSEIEKATTAATEAAQRADAAELKALRLEIAAEKGVKARWLTGANREELEACADEYLEDHPPVDATGDGKPPARKPAERLKGGTEPEEPAEIDTADILAKTPRL